MGISPAAAGTLFLVIRIWDGFADIIAGRIVDRTMTRWGKFRPCVDIVVAAARARAGLGRAPSP